MDDDLPRMRWRSRLEIHRSGLHAQGWRDSLLPAILPQVSSREDRADKHQVLGTLITLGTTGSRRLAQTGEGLDPKTADRVSLRKPTL